MKMVFTLATAEEMMEALGSRLRAQRLAQEITQRELASMAGLSLGALRKLEHNGQTSLETLIRVVQALGLSESLQDLFVPQKNTIAQMEAAERARQRQRAPRKAAS
ncbi:MAG: helix-turn-helix transcriptional regulator [Lautropia sp.]|nr:helix-turn-helix transcriptional regulator [Lautropia sp.]